MADNESNTEQNPESFIPITEQNGKNVPTEDKPSYESNELEGQRAKIDSIEKPNKEIEVEGQKGKINLVQKTGEEIGKVEGQKGKNDFIEKPYEEIGKVEESGCGVVLETGSKRTTNTKRKWVKRRNMKGKDGAGIIGVGNNRSDEVVNGSGRDIGVEEQKDGVGIIEPGDNESGVINGSKRVIEIEEVKDVVGIIELRDNESGVIKGSETGTVVEERKAGGDVETDVGNLGQNSDKSGPNKKKRCWRKRRGNNSKEDGEITVKEVEKDGLGMICLGDNGNDEVKRSGRVIGVEEVKDAAGMIGLGDIGSDVIKESESVIGVGEGKYGVGMTGLGDNVSEGIMANNASNTEQKPESCIPVSEQNGKKVPIEDKHSSEIIEVEGQKGKSNLTQKPNEEIDKVDGQKGKSHLIEKPSEDICKVEGQNGKINLVQKTGEEIGKVEGQKGKNDFIEKPCEEIGKVEESGCGVVLETGSKRTTNTKRKWVKRRNMKGKDGAGIIGVGNNRSDEVVNGSGLDIGVEEQKDGVGIIEPGDNESGVINGSKRVIEIEEVKDVVGIIELRDNESGVIKGSETGTVVEERKAGGDVETDVGNLGQSSDKSGPNKKKRCWRKRRGNNSKEDGEITVKEVEKDGLGMICLGDNGNDEVKRSGRVIGVEEVKDAAGMIGLGDIGSDVIKESESVIGVEEGKYGVGMTGLGDNVSEGIMANNASNTEQKPESCIPVSEQNGKKVPIEDKHSSEIIEVEGQKGKSNLIQKPNEEFGKVEGQKGKSHLIEKPSEDICKVEGQNGKIDLSEPPNGGVGKVEESECGVLHKTVWKRGRNRKRKRDKNGDEEVKHGVGIINLGDNRIDEVKVEGQKGKSHLIEKPSEDICKVEGQNGKIDLSEPPNGGVGKVEESECGVLHKTVWKRGRNRKRKRGKNGDEEVKHGVGIIDLGDNGIDEVKGQGAGIEVDDQKDGMKPIELGDKNAILRSEWPIFVKKGKSDCVLAGDDVGNVGQNPKQSGSRKKKRGNDSKKNCEMTVKEVEKDVEMVEVVRDGNKGGKVGVGQGTEGTKKVVVFRKCFICDATDHNAMYCPQKSEWYKNKICVICRVRGHSLESCPNKCGPPRTESAFKSAQSLKVVSAINNEVRPPATEVAKGIHVISEAKQMRKKAKQKRKKINRQQRKLEKKLGTES